MLSLKKLLGKDEKFFDLLEAGAEEAKVSVTLFGAALRKLSAGSNPADLPLDEFIQARRKEKRIREQMTEELSRTFVTPLEREDIEELSFALYRVPKQVEKIAERLSIYPGRIPYAAFERQAQLMTQAAEALVFMVKQLRGGTNVERIRDANHGPYDAKELVILQNLFEMAEQAIDRCRNAGNIVVQIVMKHS
jgi:uncharacterized protein Yka (UPF0111/DUF47 family)